MKSNDKKSIGIMVTKNMDFLFILAIYYSTYNNIVLPFFFTFLVQDKRNIYNNDHLSVSIIMAKFFVSLLHITTTNKYCSLNGLASGTIEYS